MQLLYKNTASQYVVLSVIHSSTGAPVTGDAANITGYLSKDTGANTALTTPNPTEIGNGLYRFTLTQTETNADLLSFSATSITSTSRISTLVINTSAQTPNVNITQVNGSATIDSLTPSELAKLILAFVAGKASGGGSTPVVFRNVGDTKDRITMTVDSSGNRTAVTLDVT